MKIHSGHIECAVAALLNYRVHHIVPNVSWGWDLRHEADMIAVNKSGYVTEVEIKISKQDLKNDLKKENWHDSKKIHRLAFAVPESLVETCREILPAHVGIIQVKAMNDHKGEFRCFYAEWVRNCKFDKSKAAINDKQLVDLLRLGCMRIWSLKIHNNNGKK